MFYRRGVYFLLYTIESKELKQRCTKLCPGHPDPRISSLLAHDGHVAGLGILG